MSPIFESRELNNNNNNSGKLQQASQLVLRGWGTVEFHPTYSMKIL